MTDHGSFDRVLIETVCSRLITRFAYLVDQRRYDEVSELFLPGGIFERPGLLAEGRDQIRAFMESRPLSTDTRHVCAPSFFEKVDADRSTVRTYVTMFHGEENVEPGPTGIVGTAGIVEFHDVCVRSESGWRIGRHESRVVMIRS